MTYTSITDLAACIEDLMGSEGDSAEAAIIAQACWEDGCRSDEALAERWPTDEAFYDEWVEARAQEEAPESSSYTTADTLTDSQIKALRNEAIKAGDYTVAAWCILLMGEEHELEGAEPGTEVFDTLCAYNAGGLDEPYLRSMVAEVIAEAEAQDDEE